MIWFPVNDSDMNRPEKWVRRKAVDVWWSSLAIIKIFLYKSSQKQGHFNPWGVGVFGKIPIWRISGSKRGPSPYIYEHRVNAKGRLTHASSVAVSWRHVFPANEIIQGSSHTDQCFILAKQWTRVAKMAIFTLWTFLIIALIFHGEEEPQTSKGKRILQTWSKTGTEGEFAALNKK